MTKMCKCNWLLTTLFAFASFCAEARVSVDALKCEGLVNPLGIDNTEPHFSWKLLSDKPAKQVAYEILVASRESLLETGKADLWDSGKVPSSESVMISYAGKTLKSRQLCFWKVRSYTNGETSEWSKVQRFCVGIQGEDQMRGQYIGLGLGQDKAILLARAFKIKKVGKTAFLHINSLGYHEVYLNGKKVSETVLAPAVSQMDKRSLIVTYDVTDLLQKGTNNLVLWIGSGWYKKDTFQASYEGPAVRADLDVWEDGTWNPLLKTDETWQGAESGYYDLGSWKAWEFGGEKIDARQVPTDFTTESFKELNWKPVEIAQIEGIDATPQMCQLNVVKEVISPVSVTSLGNGQWLVDMGKVLNGQFEIHLPTLPAGQEITADYSDHLKNNGEMETMKSSDIFIASGREGGDVFRNRFNHHCFRYILLSNLPQRPLSAQAYRIGMNADAIGTFESSDPDLNAIHQMVRYTMDCLAFSGYMVDCAHIERLGYGGDGNASTLSLQNMFDVAPLYMNWLQAWNDAIQPDGGLPHTAPCPYKAGGGPYWCSFIVQAPWRTWMNYGDDRLLRRCYENMKLWITYVDANMRDGLLHKWPDLNYRNWYLGDWLAPKGVDVMNQESVDLVNNCALSQSYNELIQIAQHLGKDADCQDFERRHKALNKRIHEVFFHPETNTYGTGTQLDMAYPLLTGVVPAENQEQVQDILLHGSDHLGVGLVGAPVLTEWVTQSHAVDFMYGMLKKEDYPGYLYMLRHGATATWEDWQTPRSSMHNCFNGIDSWFVQALGGILPIEPGYKSMLIDPQVPEGLNWVRVTRETPYGTVLVYWQRTNDGVKAHVEIPNGTTAILRGKNVGSGVYDIILE